MDSDVEDPTGMSEETWKCIRELNRERARQIHGTISSSPEEQRSVATIGNWSSDLALLDGELLLNLGKTNKERDAPRIAATPDQAGGENSVDQGHPAVVSADQAPRTTAVPNPSSGKKVSTKTIHHQSRRTRPQGAPQSSAPLAMRTVETNAIQHRCQQISIPNSKDPNCAPESTP